MNLLILTRFPVEYEPKRLAEEAKKEEIKAEIVNYEQLSLSWQKDKIEIGLPRDLNFAGFGLVIPRSSAHRDKKSLLGLKTALIFSLPEKTVCLNRKTFKKYPVLGKIEQGVALGQSGLSVVKSWYLLGKDRAKFLKEAQFPLIAKARFGSHSKKTFRVDNCQEAEEILTKFNSNEIFFQPLIKSRFYWRVLVLGGRVLGTMRRKTNKRFLREEEISEKDTPGVSGQIKKLALNASQVFQAEFAGVDVLVDKNDQPQVIEVNRSPQFRIFEKRTGVNVGKKIVGYLKTTGLSQLPLRVSRSASR